MSKPLPEVHALGCPSVSSHPTPPDAGDWDKAPCDMCRAPVWIGVKGWRYLMRVPGAIALCLDCIADVSQDPNCEEMRMQDLRQGLEDN